MKNILFIFLSAFLLLACQNKEAKPEVEKEKYPVEVKQTSNTSPLYLNDGKPWEINEEMKPYISKSEEILRIYTTNEADTDYESMAQVLNDENKKLIESCTMTGEPHDVLHQWLAPHLDLTAALQNAENQKEAEEVIQKLNNSFKEFHKYFK